MNKDTKNLIIALIRGMKFTIGLLEKLSRGEAV